MENSENIPYDVVVIGGGPAGATAAIYTARAGLKTLVIDKGLTTGALGITGKIANYPGFTEPISGAELLGKMRDQARGFGAEFVSDRIIGLDVSGEAKSAFGNNGVYAGRMLIIATGSMGRGTRVLGEDELLGRGVSYCATCDGAFFKDQDVAVAGNTDEAIEEALFLTRFARQVHFICPTEDLKAPEALAQELEQNPKITIYRSASLKEIGGVDAVEFVRFTQKDLPEQKMAVSGVFVYLSGGRPVTDFLQGQLELRESGCLVVNNEYQTTMPGVYAVGDVICKYVKQAVVAAGEGAVAGMAVEKALRGRKQMVVDWAK